MKNSIEDKARFFAQYFTQRVLKNRQADSKIGFNTCRNPSKSILECEYLELNSLKAITDEHAKEMGYESARVFHKWNDNLSSLTSQEADYLRKKGYLVPFDKYSCKDILKMVWAKYREV